MREAEKTKRKSLVMSPIKSVQRKEAENKTNLYSMTFYKTHTIQQ